ncbi:RNA polymerase factor sigma-54 [Paenibacillus sp. 32352]|uniref:RNA polymerase factor sigma-54 n=1 Tax=Paenibacillus sp. 32352 TaxID=1969111 RepID=UPI0009AD600A|nr:RNA polymerase factor sigma-54 [Paenibacillus sp. 32352]
MQAGLNQTQEQTMRLLITPDMKQSLHMLQCSSGELAEHMSREILSNPFLVPADTGWLPSTGPSGSRFRTSAYDPMDRIPDSSQQTLESFLLEQLAFLPHIPRPTLHAAKFIIGNLDSKGYLDMRTEHIAQILHMDSGQIEHALELVQSLDPPGIAARSLQECLMLQLERQGHKDSLAYQIVNGYLTHLAEKQFDKLAQLLKAEPDQIQQAAAAIRALNPRPGAAFTPIQREVIYPDVIVRREHNEYIVEVNESLYPKLSIHPGCRAIRRKDREADNDMQKQLHEARRFIGFIEQRNVTLYRVMQAIVQKQRPFFDYGPASLKPMTLKDIAYALGVHESTVSRAAANKYVQTPRGMYEMKSFFTSSVGGTDGEAVSSEAAKQRIKQVIQSEDKRKPLSDLRIAELMEQEGVRVSRRTVTKYRESLGIPASHLRKRL